MTASAAEVANFPERGAALARGSIYGFLAGLFASPHAGEAQESSETIAGLLAALPYPLHCPDELMSIEADIRLESEFIRLFELHISGPPCPLYGGVYGDDRQATMQELLRFYRHFGLTVKGAGQQDLPDSVATVLEFMQFLCVSESQAHTGDDVEAVRAAQRDILSRHLTTWTPKILTRVLHMSPPKLYAGAARLLNEFCFADLSHLKH